MVTHADRGLAIQLHRGVAGLSQAGLAEKAGINPKTVGSWEAGGRPDPKLLEKAIKALEITPEELEEAAVFIAKVRASKKARIDSQPQVIARQHGFSIAEGGSLSLLSDEELTLELGRSREVQLVLEGEIQARKRSR